MSRDYIALSDDVAIELGLKQKRTRMIDVLNAVSRVTGIRTESLLGPRRQRYYSRPRQLAYYLLRERCYWRSLPAIGIFMQRDHTTILYGCRKAKKLLQEDPEFRKLHDDVVQELDRL